MLKALAAVQQFSQALRLPLPLTAAVVERSRRLVAAALGSADTAAMMLLVSGWRPAE